MKLDLSVYLVTERSLLAGRKLVEVVAAAIAGGVTVVQLREKEAEGREFFELAKALLQITRPAGVPLLINDRVDVMLAADADGVHVGQEDLPADRVRRMIGPDKILGVTVADAVELDRAVRDGADYVGTNAVFATPTKTDTGTPQGLAGLQEMCRLSPVPVVGIGGIDQGNAAEVMAAGAAGCAVVRAIMGAPDPEVAARELTRVCRKP